MERLTGAAGVHLRTGCCCNPGACSIATTATTTTGSSVGRCKLTASKPVLTAKRLWFHRLKPQYDEPAPKFAIEFNVRRYSTGRARKLHASGKLCGDGMDVDDDGVPTGVVRASFGLSSTMVGRRRLNSVSEGHVPLISSKRRIYLLKDGDLVGLLASRSAGFSL